MKLLNIIKNMATISKETSNIDCPKCGHKMERRWHNKLTNKMIRQPYYFAQWDYCSNCRYIQHYEHFKVYSKGISDNQLKLI